jgi:hypothetical protein
MVLHDFCVQDFMNDLHAHAYLQQQVFMEKILQQSSPVFGLPLSPTELPSTWFNVF